MPQPTESEHRDDIARTRAGISQRVESGDPRAQQRRRVDGRQVIWKSRHRAGGGNHVFAVATVETDAGHLVRFACEQIPAPARVSSPSAAAFPSGTDPPPGRPTDDLLANALNSPG